MALVAGTRLGPYEIIDALGAGGMGEVYRARDTKLDRYVALKILPEALARDAGRLARFEREARLLAALNHPNIAQIFGLEDTSGTPALAMELVEGTSLDRAIPEEGLPGDRIVVIATALAEALIAAHERGIVHRDLKPANVMITFDGRVKVLDFGLAKDVRADHHAQATATAAGHTEAGVVMGTPAYMSPEQAAGRPLDHRTDIFSLGVVLYQMATGKPPFTGGSSAELISAILRDTPPPVTDVRAELPPGLARIIRRCLEKDPGHRLQTARDVCNEFRELASQMSAKTESATRAAAAVAIAVLPFADMSLAKDQEYLCEGMAEEIMNALVRIEGIRVASRTSAFQARRQQADLPAIARALSVGHVLEGSVRTSGSRLRVTAQLTDVASGYQLWSERFDRQADDIFSVQDEIAAGVVEAVKARLAPGQRALPARTQGADPEAYRSYLKGRFLRHTKNDHAGALRAFEEAVRLDPSQAPSWIGVAEANILVAHYSMIPAREAYAKAKEALATAERLQGESADTLFVQGFTAFMERKWKASEDTLRRALEIDPRHVLMLGACGLIYASRNRLDEASKFLQRARELDPLAAFPYAMSGVAMVVARRPREAEPYFEDAFAFEKEHTLGLWGSGMARIALGRFDEGIATLEQAVAVTRRAAFFVGLLGWGFAAAGRSADAHAILAELRARPASAPTIVSEAWLLAALGETDAAFDVLARAEEEYQPFLCYTGLSGFDPLRADPRFTALLQRLELPSA